MIKPAGTPKIKPVTGGFEGYLSTWFTLDNHGDMVLPGAFREFLPGFLEANAISSPGHKTEKPIGKYVEAIEDEIGLWVRAEYSNIEAAREVRTLVNDGVINFLSIGFWLMTDGYRYITNERARLIQKQNDYVPDEFEKDLLRRVRIVRLINRAEPYEGTPTTVPANKKARIMVRKEAMPLKVANSIDRIRSAAAGIKNRESETGIPDARLLAIKHGVEQALSEINTMIGNDPVVTKESEPEPENFKTALGKLQAAAALLKARTAS